tara:strand:- start:50 stop:223 length:174 start_codon:yes stop_codon:yes gene_type:complete
MLAEIENITNPRKEFNKRLVSKKLPEINNGIKTKKFLIQCLGLNSKNICFVLIVDIL